MKVLLCDDHSLLVETLATVLSRRGDDVLGTRRPEDAVLAAGRSRPEVCVMDLRFGADESLLGLDAAAEVLSVSPTTSLLVLTGSATPAVVREGVERGVRGFVEKGESLAVTVQAIDAVADGQFVVPQQLLHSSGAQPSPVPHPFRALTQRERQVLAELVEGKSTDAIAEALQISRATTRTHMQNLFAKLGVHSRLGAVAFADQHGFSLDDDRSCTTT